MTLRLLLFFALLFAAPAAFAQGVGNGACHFPDCSTGGGGGSGNATSISDGTVVNADVNAAAGIVGTKLACTAGGVDNRVQTYNAAGAGACSNTLLTSSSVMLKNLPMDTDGNGTYDTIWVDGDYDASGTVDLTDISAAIATLNDTKIHVIVGPGTYAYPAVDPVLSAATGNAGYIELATSNTLFECVGGWGVTVLKGLPPAASYDKNYSVIFISAVSNVEVRGCDIDGGMPTSDWNGSTIQAGGAVDNFIRTGIRTSHGTQHSFIRYVGNRVRNTTSMGLYMVDTDDSLMLNNVVDYASGYGDTTVTVPNNGGIYTYTSAVGFTANRGRMIGNKLSHATGGIVLRSEPTSLIPITDEFMLGNSVNNSIGCIFASGTRNAAIYETKCDYVQYGINGTPGGTGYQPTDLIGNKNLLIDGIKVTNIAHLGSAALIRPYQENFTLRNFVFNGGVDSDEILTTLPQRGLIVENGEILNSGSGAIQETVSGGANPGTESRERRTYRNITINGTAVGGLDNGRYLGEFTEAQAAVIPCDTTNSYSWLITTNGSTATDVTWGSGTGAVTARARCEAGTWVTFPAPGSTSASGMGAIFLGGLLTLDNVACANVGGSCFEFSDATNAYIDLKIKGADLDGLFWGYLGDNIDTVAELPACTAYNQGMWAVITDGNGASCTVGSSTTDVHCKCMISGTAHTWVVNGGTNAYKLATGAVGAIEFINTAAATNGITIQNSTFSNWIGNPGINFVAGTATGVSIQGVTATNNRAPLGLGASLGATPGMTSAVINTAATLTAASADVTCTNTLSTKPCGNGLPWHSQGVGAPDAEGCDAATENGSFWLNTSGGVGTTMYGCEDGAGVGWNALGF